MRTLSELKWTAALALLGLAAAANLLFGGRPMGFYSEVLQVEEIATLPDTPALAGLRRIATYGSGRIWHMRAGAGRYDPLTQPLRIGWVYRERGFLGMPYGAENVSTGPTLYVDDGEAYIISGVSRADIALIEREIGRPAVADYRFAWYRHAWGLLFPPLLALLGWLSLRERRAREEREWSAAPPEAA